MSRPSTKPPSGTRDFLPQEVARRRYVVQQIQSGFERYGFAPLETPAFENLSVLTGKYGEEGDQLLFRLLHRRDALARALEQSPVTEGALGDLGLRYDLTVPLARVIAQYGDLPRFFKRYQIQPVWRADRPGRGRYREFYQCDVDSLGSTSEVADAEILAAVCEVMEGLGFEEFRLRLNHRAVLRGLVRAAGIADEAEQTALVAVDKLDKIGEEGVVKELVERGIDAQAGQRLLESIRGSEAGNAEVLEALGRRLDDEASREGLATLGRLLDLVADTPAGRHVRVTPDLARGLSYYTGPIFEIDVPDLAGSLGGGGRYDGLIGMFGKRSVPAVGFSLGLERIVLVMEERGMYPPLPVGPDVLVCWMGAIAAAALGAARELRRGDLRVEVYPEEAKLGKQLQYADQIGAPVAAILGDDEVASGQITLKHLQRGEQVRLPLADAARHIASWAREETA